MELPKYVCVIHFCKLYPYTLLPNISPLSECVSLSVYTNIVCLTYSGHAEFIQLTQTVGISSRSDLHPIYYIFHLYCASNMRTTSLTVLVVLWPCQNCTFLTRQKCASSTGTKFICRKKNKYLGKHEHMVGSVLFPAILFSHRK